MTDTPSEKRMRTIAMRQEMQKMVQQAMKPKNRKKQLEDAQQLVYDAWEAPTRKRAVELARRALELSGDCADAFCILAELRAQTDEEAIDLYRQGIEAGRRALGKKAFREDADHFWLILETRPFMRAMDGLAVILSHTDGKESEAVEIWREMLRLNPGDNQGARYRLLSLLTELGRDAEAWELLEQYAEDYLADWAYARALLAFRQEGDTGNSRSQLDRALEKNRHVPKFMLGKKKLPKRMNDYITPGEEDEAISCCEGYLIAWAGTPGALGWLSRQAGVPIGARPRRPTLFPSQEKKQLTELLKRAADPDSALTLEELHGFLFGLAITPEAVMPNEWLPQVFGEEMTAFRDEKEASFFLDGLFGVFNRLVGEQREGTLGFPGALEKASAAPYAEDWCYGLFLALTLRPEVWDIEDDDVGAALEKGEGAAFAAAVVSVLGFPGILHEIGGDARDDAPSETEKFDFYLTMLEMLPAAVAMLCREGRDYEVRRRRESLHVVPRTPRSREKIGRNDPCPCGSGKKYKKCCG
ncbi:MAG: YecA family protein [Deltaproteobacteria bacterium]|nr:YecA family protein [Deltaproteobacteria bacterium]